MSTSNGSKLSMKVVMNKEKSKVLFAEADSDVVDVLLSFLTLPLGKIVGVLEKHHGGDAPIFGSLTTLYSGLLNLNSTKFCSEGAKQMLLNPATSFQLDCRRLKIDISDSQPRKVYYCQDSNCSKPLASNVSMYSDIAKCSCGKPLNREELVEERQFKDGGVFTMKEASFIIFDDLRIVPVVTKFLQTLNSLGIADIQGAEMSALSIDIDDVMHLFMYSLISVTPLMDLIIKKTPSAKTDSVSFFHHIQKRDGHSKKMILTVYLLKSTNKFLLAVATDEFVQFLFSFLVVPLGGVEYLLGGKTCLNNIDNLYRSVTDMINDEYFMTSCIKNRLMNPKLPFGYTTRNQFLPLMEESAPDLEKLGKSLTFKSSEGKRSFVNEKTMYIVSDDLMVTPFSMISTISIINSHGVSLSDVKEIDFQIGLVEGLDILLASLSSTTVLTDALVNPMLNKSTKQPKIEP